MLRERWTTEGLSIPEKKSNTDGLLWKIKSDTMSMINSRRIHARIRLLSILQIFFLRNLFANTSSSKTKKTKKSLIR
jgi:hypothetical protein